jgi:hypothetical protein
MVLLLQAESRFVVKNGGIFDRQTDLTWQKKPSSDKFTYQEAIKHCEDLYDDGYSDWELPSIDALKSLVDYKQDNSAIATGLISVKLNDYYWSETKHAEYSSNAWELLFKNGNDNWNNQSFDFYALCVRGQ